MYIGRRNLRIIEFHLHIDQKWKDKSRICSSKESLNHLQVEWQVLLSLSRRRTDHYGWRVTIEYINSFTIECQYPMPIVQNVLNKVGQSNVISVFDCRSAYWTCPVKESDQWKTAVVTHNLLYEFTRAIAHIAKPLFGMVNSGITFVKATINAFAEPYLDDIAVHSYDWQMHLKHLE